MKNIVYLLDIQSDNMKGWFLNTSRNKERLFKELQRASGSTGTDFSDVILDIAEVIIDPEIEKFLYQQIRENNLEIIDNTKDVELVPVDSLKKPLTEMVEGVDYRHVLNPSGVIDKKHVELIKGTLQFRNEAFQKVKFLSEQKKLAVPLIDYFEKKIEDNRVIPYKFTRESAKRLLEDVIKFRQQSEHRFLVSLEGISDALDLESTKELAAFLISQNKIVEVSKHTTRTTFALRVLLPTIAQLCADFSTTSVIWEDIRRRYPEGSELYISPSEGVYEKYRVVRNEYINKKGENILHKDVTTLTEVELFNYTHMTLHKVKQHEVIEAEDNIDDFDDATKVLTDEFDLTRNLVIGRFIIIVPCAILEGTDYPYGMPNIKEGELKKHLDNNIIERRQAMLLSPNYGIWQVNEQTNASTNWIRMYRKNMSKFYARFGLELPVIDLMKIMEGERSPLEQINLSKLSKQQMKGADSK